MGTPLFEHQQKERLFRSSNLRKGPAIPGKSLTGLTVRWRKAFWIRLIGFLGAKGMRKLIAELPSWNCSFDNAVMEEICRFLVMFTGSVLPNLPKELDESDLSGLDNPHRGTRDRFAEALIKYTREFGSESWAAAAEYFDESGALIEEIAEGFTQMILNRSYSDLPGCIPLFERLLESETKAYSRFLLSPTQRR